MADPSDSTKGLKPVEDLPEPDFARPKPKPMEDFAPSNPKQTADFERSNAKRMADPPESGFRNWPVRKARGRRQAVPIRNRNCAP